MSRELKESIKQLIARAKEQGYVTVDELATALPADHLTSAQIESALGRLSELGINIVDDPPQGGQIDYESACARGARRMEMAIVALRHGRVRHACQLPNTTLAELQPFADHGHETTTPTDRN